MTNKQPNFYCPTYGGYCEGGGHKCPLTRKAKGHAAAAASSGCLLNTALLLTAPTALVAAAMGLVRR